jgi:hypothetical protein
MDERTLCLASRQTLHLRALLSKRAGQHIVVIALLLAPEARGAERSYFDELSLTDAAGIGLAALALAPGRVPATAYTQGVQTTLAILASSLLSLGPTVVHLSERERYQAARSFTFRAAIPVAALALHEQLGTTAAWTVGITSFVGGVVSDYRHASRHDGGDAHAVSVSWLF